MTTGITPLVGSPRQHAGREFRGEVAWGAMAKKRRPKSRTRPNTSITDHRRVGKRLIPPLAGMPNMTPLPWLPDIFPDMLWLCSLITADLDEGMLAANATLRRVDDAVRETEGDLLPKVVDGRLTRLELVPDAARTQVLNQLEAESAYEIAVPEGFAHALGMYPDAPGSWLIEPWLRRGLRIDWEHAERYLTDVITTCHHGQGRAPTRAKFIALARHAAAHRLSVADPEIIRLFPKYPNDLEDEERARVEATTRAMFMATLLADDRDDPLSAETDRAKWARTFWRSNWHIFPCRSHQEDDDAPTGVDSLQVIAFDYREQAIALHERFLSVAKATDPDLYDPDRYEVLTGIVGAGIRSIDAAATSPVFWSGEHGLGLIRSLVESLIVVRWLIRRDDSSMYRRFKDYGRGHLKLLKLNIEEYIDSIDDPPSDLRRYAAHLDAEVNAEVWEEWQEVDLGGSFSGIDLRRMALDVGMDNDYRFVFAPTSAAMHREWTVLDRYALNRCLNPLHRWHRIPQEDLGMTLGSETMTMAVGFVADTVDEYLAVFRPRADEVNDGESV